MKNLTHWTILVKAFIIILLVLSAVFVAYSEALNNGFITTWDTGIFVVDNNYIRSFSWENIQWMFTTVYKSYWHPLTWVSHASTYSLFGLDPWGHHLVSIIIHALNTSLLFVLVMLLMSFKTENHSGFAPFNNKILLTAGLTAFLFGVHPQHVESVVWITERKDVLCLFFILLTLIAYVFYRAAHTAKTRFKWYCLTLLCFILSLLAKPMAVTIPVVLLLMDVYPLKKTPLTASQTRKYISYQKLFIEKIPFFILTLSIIVITILATRQETSIASINDIGIEIRLLNSFNNSIFYISKFLLPIGLSPYYPFPSYRNFYEYYPSLIPVIAFFLITAVCFYLWYQKKYYWLMTWLFYLITLSPVIGMIQAGSQAAADRYAYLPTIPFYFLLAFGIVHLLYTERYGRFIKSIIMTGVFLMSLVFMQQTYKQSLVWKNDMTFWGSIAALEPENAFIHFQMGNLYYAAGSYNKAIERFQKAIFFNKQRKWFYAINLSASYINANRLPEALAMLNNIVKSTVVQDELDEVYSMIGWVYWQQGLLVQAQDSLLKAVHINPQNNKAQNWLLELQAGKKYE